jgi:glycosyltransferase involved in cell wall biosynthesis
MTILFLTTYPLRKSIHGGQRRSKAIVKAYTRAGAKVVTSAVFNPPSYAHKDERHTTDLPAPAKTVAAIKKVPILEDVVLGQACYDDPEIKKHIVGLLQKHKPDYINFEQPYLYIGVQKILEEMKNPPKIIFSSQNVEYKMKQVIYGNHPHEISEKLARENVELIKATETALSQRADIVVAVSESDAAEHRAMGAPEVLVIPNGINPEKTTPAHISKWQELFKKQGISKPILFTGSAHPPNWTGFLDMMGTRLGFLPIHSKLMIVGDIGNALEYVVGRDDPVYGSTFWLRSINCKRLSDEDLSALIQLCDTIILPITEGGGSNLKTAEAILSGKKIIATQHAMRGYDDFLSLPNLFVEKTPEGFKNRLTKTLELEVPVLTPDQKETVKKVSWAYRTKELEKLVGGLK